jgi:hypothetical protein
MLDGWLEFNRRRAGVEPIRLCTEVRGIPSLEAVLYTDRRGRLVLPTLNPYLPIAYAPSSSSKPLRMRRHWLRATAPLVAEMRRRGIADNLILSPVVADARPWLWAGFRTTVGYTILNPFPVDPAAIDHDTSRRVRRAEKNGYRWTSQGSVHDVMGCVAATESRKGFRNRLSGEELESLVANLGSDHARTYVCNAPGGDAASATVILHRRPGIAVGLISGTRPEYFKDGAAQFLMHKILQDLSDAGAAGVDLAGADIHGVAVAKDAWGGRLLPVFHIEPYSVRNALRWGRDWLRQSRRVRNAAEGRDGPL